MGTLQAEATGGDDDRNAGGDRDRRGSDGDWGSRLRTDDLFRREEPRRPRSERLVRPGVPGRDPDVIDPNPRYSTDRWKSTLAEIATLGAADAYDIHITWHRQTTVILDANGNVRSISGYPAP